VQPAMVREQPVLLQSAALVGYPALQRVPQTRSAWRTGTLKKRVRAKNARCSSAAPGSMVAARLQLRLSGAPAPVAELESWRAPRGRAASFPPSERAP
jgi:hypothetical protein